MVDCPKRVITQKGVDDSHAECHPVEIEKNNSFALVNAKFE